uniref:Uncharacterized protein n=1 Tax=Avena sativa TaxID=4498 RepID=A0ACD6AGC0_AVESA
MTGDVRLLLLLVGFAACLLATSSRAQPTEVKVGLIIDADSPVGKIATTTIPMALEDFYAAFPNSTARVQILQHDSGGDVVAAASAALQLMTSQGARAILGPQSSVESAFVAGLATQAEVPVVSFSSTSPSVSPATARFFSRAAQSDALQAGAVAALATLFGWRRVVPIYQDDDYGAAFVPFLVDALASERAAEVPYRCALPADTSPDALAAEMYRMESEQTRVFVLHARAALARRVFAAAEEAGMTGEGYVWVITQGLTGLLGSVQPPQGVIGLAPYVPTTPRLRDVKKRWAQRYMRDHPDDELSHAVLGCYAVWAYDAAWAMASAAERLSAADLSTQPGLVNGTGGPTDISGLGKSASGENFLQAINDTEFEGLGGRFDLVDGELVVPAYRVLNIMDDGKERGVGFWSPAYGLTRHVGSALAPVIWPGESTVRPSGWVQPTNARKLRVAVPGNVSDSYRSILHLEVDSVTKQTTAGGFVIEVFEAAVRLLPYALPFEYVKAESQPYDNLILGVENGTFDAVVADMTITADRAAHVDFTLPYMSSDIAMVVPLRDQRGGNFTWFFFLKPLSSGLWLVSAAFFLFTGFVVWAIEHRDNGEFGAEVEITPSNKGKLTPTNQAGTKGKLTPSNQVGTLVYFGFSTLVFSHREKLTSNLSRLVVIVWVFVVLILQSSYTASLTSMLTVPRVEPTIVDYLALLRGTEKVGIMNNSFTGEALTRSGFPQARIMRYSTARSFQEALLNKSIGAVVNETPYFNIFLKTYSDNFTMTDQRNMTGGLGFAFPKGSPYVMDLSRAIMNLTESDEINKIQRKWFGDLKDGDSQFTSGSLNFKSFGSLFLLTGVTSLVCCVVHLIFNFYADNRRQPAQQITPRHSSPREAHCVIEMASSQHSASSSYTSEGSGSMEMAILPSDEIEPFTGGQREEAVSPTRQRA